MQALILSKSFAGFREFCKQYNQGKEICQQLRGNVQRTYEHLLKVWSAQINKTGYVAALSTNSVSLSKALTVSDRTVRRHIQKLKSAGLIETVFHGSRADYEVIFTNSDFLEFGIKLTPENVDAMLSEALRAAGLSPMRTNLPDIGNPSSKINKENKAVENAKNNPRKAQSLACAFSGMEINDLETSLLETQGTKTPGADKLQGPGNDTGGKDAHRPPAREISGPALAGLMSYVLSLWQFALINIFHRLDFLAESQKLAAQNFFYMELLQVPENQRLKEYSKLMIRLKLVARWLEKNPGKFVQVPEKYFHPDNPNGFQKTALWLANQKKLLADIEAEKAKMRNVRALRGALREYGKEPTPRAMLKMSQRLAKIHPEISKLFLEEVRANPLLTNNL